MSTMWYIRFEVICIIIMLMVGVPVSRRVLVAWIVWIFCRWDWRHQRQSVRRWLWIKTIRHANGKDEK